MPELAWDMSKILFINTTDARDNAVSSIIYNLKNELTKYGIISKFAAGRHSQTGGADYIIDTKIEVYTHTLLSRLFDTEGRHSIQATLRLIKYITDNKFDILHIHNLHGHYINYPTLFEWINRNKIPTIITLHDCWTLTGHCATFFHNKCTPPEQCSVCTKANIEYPFSYSFANIFKSRKKNLDLKKAYLFNNKNISFVAVSNWLKNQVISTGLTNNIITIYNGVDTTIFSPNRKENKKFRILFITHNWEAWKSPESVINFAKYLRNDEEITIAGNIYGHKMPSNITHIENINTPSDVAKLYNSHDLFISPSIAETFGMTTVEAMACGLPVIVNNSAALPELLSDDSGIITDTSSPENIRRAIDIIRQNYDSYNPRKHVLEHFTSSVMAENYAKLYQRIL